MSRQTPDLGTLTEMLTALDLADHLKQVDQPALGLAKLYAAQIDRYPELLSDLGPKLLAVLTALGATPAGRNAKGGQSGPAPATALDAVAQRAAIRRANRTKAV